MKLRPQELVGTDEVVGFPLATPDGWFSIDTECTGLDPWASSDRPFAISLCNADGETAFIRWKVNPRTRAVVLPDLTPVAKLLSNPKLTAVLHNRAYDKRMLQAIGLQVRCKTYDTLIAQHVINPDELSFGLKQLCKKYLGISDSDQKDLHDSAKKARVLARKQHPDWKLGEVAEQDMWMADPELLKKYAVEDAIRTAKLYLAQQEEIKSFDEKRLTCLEDEMRLMDVVEAMENRGIALDADRVAELDRFYTGVAQEAQRKIPRGLNPKSPQQMCEFFFGKKGYVPKAYGEREDGTPVPCPHCATPRLGPDGKPVRAPTKTKAGKPIVRVVKDSPGCKICQGTGKSPKCDGHYLAEIAGDDDDGKYVIKDKDAYYILRYDGAQHMLVNFINAYQQMAVHDETGQLCLHPNYKQCGPITGRLSCEKPNLMQVASNDTGRKTNDVPYRVRECFIPRKDFLLYLPDYSQIEVWIFAFISQDQAMMKTLLSGGDFHGGVAKLVWGHLWDHDVVQRVKDADPKTLTPEEKKHLHSYKQYRKRAKLLMFSKLYGGGYGAQAAVMGCSVEDAKKFAAEYDQRIPGVKRFMERMVREGRERGYIMTPFGRYYPIQKNFAYKATNYIVQGSAAGLMKRAMLNVHALCQTPKYKGKMFPLLTIHDELIIETHNSIHSEATMRDVVTAMQQDHKVLGCPVPFPVGMKISRERWSETQEVEL